MKTLFKRIAGAALAAAMAASMLCTTAFAAEKKEFETAKQAVANMHAGICIGNSLDSVDLEAEPYDTGVHPGWGDWRQGKDVEMFEKAFGNPQINEKYIKAIKKAGYDVVRLPVTWSLHTDAKGNIRKDWLDRVQEVVDMILDEGMYCILNTQYDCPHWIHADEKNYKENSGRFEALWKNIALRFKDYDEKLIFEAVNEMVSYDDDGNICWAYVPKGKDFVKWNEKYLQLFVNAVRKTGGNNSYRNLLVNPYCACFGWDDGVLDTWGVEFEDNRAPINDFKLPEDIAKDHLIIGIHYYEPYNFCHSPNDDPEFTADKWGTAEEKERADQLIKMLSELGERCGAPVIFGEIGAVYKKNSKEVVKWVDYHVSTAAKYGIVCLWYDDTNITAPGVTQHWWDMSEEEEISLGLFNRFEGKPVWTDVINTHILAAYGGKLPAPKLTASQKGSAVTLKWEKVSGAYGYRVYEYDASSKKYKQIAYIKSTQKTIKGLSKGTHKYKVVPTAQYSGKTVNGSSSNVVKVTVE